MVAGVSYLSGILRMRFANPQSPTDYIFSVIKKFRKNSNFVLPDRSAVTMTVPFMDAYVKLLIKTCHKRGVHAMVSIPISMRKISH